MAEIFSSWGWDNSEKSGMVFKVLMVEYSGLAQKIRHPLGHPLGFSNKNS